MRGDMSLTVFVGLLLTLSTKSRKFGSTYLVDRLSGGEIWLLVVLALLYITAKTGTLAQEVPLRHQNTKMCKNVTFISYIVGLAR